MHKYHEKVRKKVQEYIFNFEKPIICTCIHNGHGLSSEFTAKMALTDTVRKQEEDPYTDFFTLISNNRIINYTSRFEVDMNRQKAASIYEVPSDCWGLVCRSEPLTGAEKEKAWLAYDKFYQRVDVLIEEMLREHAQVIILDIHAYNHRRGGSDAPAAFQRENPDIILGRSNMDKKWYPLVEKLRTQLANHDYYGKNLDVRVDVKFPGGNFPRHINAKYGERVCAIAVEFKKIFMDEWTGELDTNKQARLREILAASIYSII